MAHTGRDRNAKTTKNSLGKQKYRRDADIKLEEKQGVKELPGVGGSVGTRSSERHAF